MSPKAIRLLLFLLGLAILPRLPAQGPRIEFTSDDKLQQRLAANREKNKARMETLEALFAQSGCKGSNLQRQAVKGHALPNVICTLPGTGGGTVVAGAHFDHVAIGSGVVDNWSGASLLPSLYEGLAKSPRTLTFIFAGFTGEETGLHGSQFFVKQWKRDKRPLPLAMVNLDTIGLTPTKVGVSTPDKRLVDILWRLSQAMKLPLMGMNAERIGTSDHEEFANAKVPSLDVHSITTETMRYLHSHEDQPGNTRFDYYRDTYKLMAGFLSLLDSMQAQAAGQPAR
jgi:hypothetical protein